MRVISSLASVFLFCSLSSAASDTSSVEQEMKGLCLGTSFFQMIRGCKYVVNSGRFENDPTTLGIAKKNLSNANQELQRRSDKAEQAAKMADEEKKLYLENKKAEMAREKKIKKQLEVDAVKSDPELLDASSKRFVYEVADSLCQDGNMYACKNMHSAKEFPRRYKSHPALKALTEFDFTSARGDELSSALKAIEIATLECEKQDFSKRWLLERALQSCLFITKQKNIFNNQLDQLAVAYSNQARVFLYRDALEWEIKRAGRKNSKRFVWPDKPENNSYYVYGWDTLKEAHRILTNAREFHLEFLRDSGVQEASRAQMIKSTVWFHNRHELAVALRKIQSPKQQLSDIKPMQFAHPAQYISDDDIYQKTACLKRSNAGALVFCKMALESNLWKGDSLDLIKARMTLMARLTQAEKSGNTDMFDLEFAHIDFSGMNAASAEVLKSLYKGDNDAVTAVFSGDKAAAARFIARYALSYPYYCAVKIGHFSLKLGNSVVPGYFVSGPLKGIPDDQSTTVIRGRTIDLMVLEGFQHIIRDTRVYAYFGHTGFGSFNDTAGPCVGRFLDRLHANMLDYYRSL